MLMRVWRKISVDVALCLVVLLLVSGRALAADAFRLEEASIADVHRAILAKQLTATQLVTRYLKRIEAYNGTCVKGVVDAATGYQLGDVEGVEHAGKLNAIMTLNLRGKRSKTDASDRDPAMPDALEQARALDEEFARTGALKGPLHGIPFVIKDQFDTFDMRTTAGAVAAYANDRPPADAEVVARLRKAGAIILGKGNMGEYASGDRNTFGGTACNPYDTSRSAGRSSGGVGAAVAANLTMCGIGEETGPSARNPAANNSLVAIVATHSLVSRAGIIPASMTRDRPGVLCRSVADAATVLSALAGYDPKDAATAESVGRVSERPYQSYAVNADLRGVRIGVVREFMQPFTRADEDSVRIGEEALRELAKAGATLVDPGPKGALFKEAIAAILPQLDAATLAAVYREMYPSGTSQLARSLELTGNAKLTADVSLRLLVEREPPTSGEVLFVMNRYLRERGDKNIRSVADLLAKSTFFGVGAIDGVTTPPKQRLEDLLAPTQTLRKKSDGSVLTLKVPAETFDITRWHAVRTTLQMLVDKVMADNRLDALVYPTKTIPAPLLANPVEPTNLKTVKETETVVVNGEAYERVSERVTDLRAPLAPRLSPHGGLPAIAVPAGFTREVYDRVAVKTPDGGKKAGELAPPKAVALPVSIDFLGRKFSEATLIRIAAAYEQATHHRRAPADFPPLADEPQVMFEPK